MYSDFVWRHNRQEIREAGEDRDNKITEAMHAVLACLAAAQTEAESQACIDVFRAAEDAANTVYSARVMISGIGYLNAVAACDVAYMNCIDQCCVPCDPWDGWDW